MASANDGQLAGFLCPICKATLESTELLKAHYDTHKENESEPVILRKFDIRSSMRKIFDKAVELQTASFNRVIGGTSEYRPVTISEASTSKTNVESSMKQKLGKAVELRTRDGDSEGHSKAKRAVTISEAELRSKDLLQVFTGKTDNEKVKLSCRSYTDELVKLRLDKLKNQGRETYRILENLKKYLNNEKPDKSLWMKVKTEVDSAMETNECTCTGCKKHFKLTRRKHSCKLCEAALCDSCSFYIEADIAGLLVNESEVPKKSVKPLRHCEDCALLLKVIQARSIEDGLDSKFTETYKEMQNLKRQISQTVVTYKEIYESLVKGQAIHDPSQAVMVRDHIGKRGREIALLGKLIAKLPAEPETRQVQLQMAIMKATDSFVEELLALPKVPPAEAIEEARLHRRSCGSVRSRRESGLMWDDL